MGNDVESSNLTVIEVSDVTLTNEVTLTATLSNDGELSASNDFTKGDVRLTVFEEWKTLEEMSDVTLTDEVTLTATLSNDSGLSATIDFTKGDAGLTAFEEWKTLEGNEEKTFDDFLSELGGNEIKSLINYDRTQPTTISVGGVEVGTTFKGTIQNALDKLFYPNGVESVEGLTTENEVMLLSEDNLILENSSEHGVKISELPETNIVDGFVPVVQNGETKKINIQFASSGGNTNIHIGTEPPQNTTYMWIDTSVPFNLDVSTYEGRLRIKYIEMLNQVIEKINSLSEKINKIEENINKISSDNSVKINESKAQLSSIMAKITSLLSRVNETQFQLMNGGDLPLLKSAAKQLRKEMKQDILYSLADLNYNVMVILDNEVQFIQPDNPSTPNDPSIDVDNSTLLTEDGFMLLTEDGLVILIDGATSSDNIKNAILTELGQVILTEDGSIILIDGGTSSGGSSDILQGAILTEQGKVLLLENGKQLLKG